jgi:hypothetical protein
MGVNLKELVVLFEEDHLRRPGLQEPDYSSLTHILNNHPFKLTRFVNGYFSQNDRKFREFLRSQLYLKSLELHSGEKIFYKNTLFLNNLQSLACPAQFLYGSWCMKWTRLRIDFEISLVGCETDVLGSLLRDNKKITSLAIFLKQKRSHLSEIIRVIALSRIDILHLEIHQFSPIQVRP